MTYSKHNRNSTASRRARSDRAIVSNRMLRDIARMDGLPKASRKQARQLLAPKTKPKRVCGKVVRLVKDLNRVTKREGVSHKSRSKARKMIKLIIKRSRDENRQWVEAMVTKRQLRMGRSTGKPGRSTFVANPFRKKVDNLPRSHRGRVLLPHGGRKVGSHQSRS